MSPTSLLQIAAPLAAPTVLRAGSSVVDTIERAESTFRDLLNLESSDPTPSTSAPSLQEAAHDFRAKLQERLRAFGIDATQPLEVRLDFFDGIKVSNHPDHVVAEQLIRSNDQLLSQLKQLIDRYQREHQNVTGDPDKVTVRVHGDSLRLLADS